MKFSEMPYERVDLEKLKADFAALERDFDAAGSGEEQFRVHQRYYAVTGHAITEMTIAEIRHDIDMTDEFYREEQKYCDEIRPVFQNLCVSYQKKLYASPYRAYLESVIGPVAFRNMELEAKSVDPRIIPLMQEENRLQDAYNHILATAKIDWNGETLNLSLLEPYLRSADRRTRIEAYAKRDAFYLAHAEEFDDLYDRLV
ncbi:MAG: M3 family oligoendopeptidase, partial [Lachnospiraceae bacterium]|nr:M3 family oligoendopeptidase [Lachnospiraceae bacterium]